MTKLLRPGLALVITSLFIWVVHTQVGWGLLLDGWQSMPAHLLFLATALTVISASLRGLRILLSFPELSDHPLSVLHLSFTHNLLNNLLPMRLGELSFPVMMKRRFLIAYLKSGSHLVIYRLMDLYCLFSIAMIVVAAQFSGLLACGLALIALLAPWQCQRFCLSAGRFLEGSRLKFAATTGSALTQLASESGSLYQLFLTTALIWTSKLAAFAMVVTGVAGLDWSTSLAAVIAADLSSVLPVHGLAGTGTFEAAFVGGAAWSGETLSLLLEAAVFLHAYLLAMSLLLYLASTAILLCGDRQDFVRRLMITELT